MTYLKSSPHAIKVPKAIFFDLGDVLLKLDWLQASIHLGIANRPEVLKEMLTIQGGEYDQYERGLISTDRFFSYFQNTFSPKESISTLLKGWETLVKEPIPGIEEVIQEIHPTFPIYIASNISPNMLEHLFKPQPKYEFLKRFEKVYASCEMNTRKPEAQFYLLAAQDAGFHPSEILFIDDREENVLGAKKVGLNAEICIHSASDLKQILRTYKVLE